MSDSIANNGIQGFVFCLSVSHNGVKTQNPATHTHSIHVKKGITVGDDENEATVSALWSGKLNYKQNNTMKTGEDVMSG